MAADDPKVPEENLIRGLSAEIEALNRQVRSLWLLLGSLTFGLFHSDPDLKRRMLLGLQMAKPIDIVDQADIDRAIAFVEAMPKRE